MKSVAADAREILKALDLKKENEGATDGKAWFGSGGRLEVRTPITGEAIGSVKKASAADYDRIAKKAEAAFADWRDLPAPKRGDLVRKMADRLRKEKEPLGRLVTLENGKILQEGMGEIQEMIDIADYSVGLSRQLYGLTMATERPEHRMYEQWHPLGVIGIVTAFNFPTAVWSWNSMIAAVCGDTMVWKPSSSTPLAAIATTRVCNEVLSDAGFEGVMTLAVGGGEEVGQRMVDDPRIKLVSATGSCAMGYKIYESVARRMGRCLLELGGNNGVIVAPSADLRLAARAILFGAVGTAGQRCTSIRRLIVHEDVKDELVRALVRSYKQVAIGNPLDPKTLMGPLINEGAVKTMMDAIATAKKQGGKVLSGGKARDDLGATYVEPTIVEAEPSMGIVDEETFAPILYVLTYKGFDEALKIHNQVPQGLSSACFTNDVRESEAFLSARGSDCGIANINIGTSGAEIGGAFGGEKDTGGGREAGSDSWKQYMRRQTVTVNYGRGLPLAQGIRFEVD